jgi:peptidoglycan-associated lipoprotein
MNVLTLIEQFQRRRLGGTGDAAATTIGAAGLLLGSSLPARMVSPWLCGAAGAAAAAAPTPAPQSQVATVQAGQMGSKGVDGLPAGVGRIVYFDFDSYSVRDDGRPVVEAHARLLTANRARKMTVEGHTDERGGREYNLALGQKRAEAVVRALSLLGATDAQLEAVSFGEERPSAQGSDEAAWAKNRRAELKDRS